MGEEEAYDSQQEQRVREIDAHELPDIVVRLIINKEFAIDDIASQKVPAPKKPKEDEGAAIANNMPADSEGKDAVPWS